jgi:hypothetical protein
MDMTKKTIEAPGMLLPEIDDVTRREFLIGSAGLLLLPAEGTERAKARLPGIRAPSSMRLGLRRFRLVRGGLSRWTM